MISTIGRAATILALCFSLGLQWIALQSVAWTAMLVQNARHQPLSEAVARTFDGAHPCDLCHAVAAGKKSEQKSQVSPTYAKIDLICLLRPLRLQPPSAGYTYPHVSLAFVEWSAPPPVPPPRALLA